MEIQLSDEVREALESNKPVVALESTVIAHGLPRPQNLETALKLESIVREGGAIPATIAMFAGKLYAGLEQSQVEYLASADGIRKISRRDLAIAGAKKLDCATTVSTTVFAARRAGISISRAPGSSARSLLPARI